MFIGGDAICSNRSVDPPTASNIQLTTELLYLTNVVVLVISKYLFFFYVLKKFGEYDDENLTPSDFTVTVQIPLPKSIANEEELDLAILKIINQNKPENEPEIKFIKKNLIYDSKEYLEKLFKKFSLSKRIKVAKLKNKPDLPKLNKKMETLEAELKEISKNYFEHPYFSFTGWCFVTFNTQQEAQTVIARNQLSKFRIFGRPFNYQRSPEPNDILWANWSITTKQRLRKMMRGIFLSFLIISINFGAILGIEYGKVKLKKNLHNDNYFFYFNLLISVLTIIINAVLSFLVRNLSFMESRPTQGDYYNAMVTKITYSNFINTALVVLITSRIASEQSKWNIVGFSGVIGSMMIMMIVNTFADSLLFLLDPTYILRRIQQNRLISAIKKATKIVLQSEANEAFEGMPTETYIFYNYCFKTVCIAFFYQAILPYGLLLGIAELTIKFFVFKYALIHRFKKPIEHELNFSIDMIRLFEFLIFILVLGFTFFNVIFKDWIILSGPVFIILMVIAVFEWVFGVRAVGLFWNYLSRSPVITEGEPTYTEVHHDFIFDYDLMNPMTVIDKLRERMDNNPPSNEVKDRKSKADDFKQALHFYAAHLINQMGGERVYHEEIQDQNSSEDPKPENEEVPTVAPGVKLNPYHLIHANYYEHRQEMYIQKRDSVDQKLSSRKMRVSGEESTPERPKPRRRHHYQDIVQNVIGSFKSYDLQISELFATQTNPNVTKIDLDFDSMKQSGLS